MNTSDTPTPAFLLRQKFPFQPTKGQLELFNHMEKFLSNDDAQTFLLKGYAGTGKTTLISTLVKSLPKLGFRTVLLAPTGRAAKVMATYSRKKAMTIHKKIYRQVANKFTGALEFRRQNNYHTNTVFIVDEASMIPDEADFGGMNGLLTDLIEYAFGNEEGGPNKLLFVGDLAQLPPVGKDDSPALDAKYLRDNFHMDVMEVEMTDVMRQDNDSGILANATRLREILWDKIPEIRLSTRGFRDCFRMTGEKLEDGINYAYRKYGEENTIVITRSNKTAVAYNRYIRTRIKYQEDEISTGDRLMVVRNNYTALDEDSPAGFLANGDFVEVLKIRGYEEQYGIRFANCLLQLSDYPDQPPFDAKITLNTLDSASPSLTREESKALYDGVAADYEHIASKRERMQEIRKDPYLNALQVKFAYALTCHKSQGGQWSAVFIDQGYLTLEQVNQEFVRWLYTAMTRASLEVFLVNFHGDFFES
ncbi:ATP-dependent DNA helicase [Siphonobacter sp.]|uniref:ATP-dependent DNA helicase n=1 Tax=Siphonobacter sp. TaxID=1869184 RepID=UPI003B3B6135